MAECSGPSVDVDIVRWTASIEPAASDDEPMVAYALRMFGPDGVVAEVGPVTVSPRGGPVEVEFEAVRDSLDDGSYCLVAQTFDAAGNEADPIESCHALDPDALFGASCSVGPRSDPSWLVLVWIGLLAARRRASPGRR